MRVALVALPNPILASPLAHFPQSLLYVASSLLRAGHQVQIVDLRARDFIIREDIPDDTECVGVTATSGEIEWAQTVGRLAHARGIKTMLGGAHASFVPEEAGEHYWDYIVKGDGELAAPEALRRGVVGIYEMPLADLTGWFPFPGWSLVGERGLSRELFTGAGYGQGPLTAGIISSRGCGFHCSYCRAERDRIRLRLISDVVGEIQTLQESYGVTHFRFYDENFSNPKPRALKLYEALEPLNIKMRCLLPDNLIRTSFGFKRIVDINEGDKVLTSEGTYARVQSKWSREYNGAVLKITTYYDAFGLQVTPEHKLLVLQRDRKPHFRKRWIPWRRAIWLEASKVQLGDYLIYPVEKGPPKRPHGPKYVCLPVLKGRAGWKKQEKWFAKKRLPVDRHLLSFLAWYITEGSSTPTVINFHLGALEKENIVCLLETIRQLLGKDAHLSPERYNCQTITICCKPVAQWLRTECGHSAKEKQLPTWVTLLSKEKLEYLFNELLKGDGSVTLRTEGTKNFQYVTTSQTLALQVRDIAFRLGYFASLSVNSSGKPSKIRGRTIKRTGFYTVRFSQAAIGHTVRAYRHKRLPYVYLQVRKVEETQFDGQVFDLTVPRINDFSTITACVHNCHTRSDAWDDELATAFKKAGGIEMGFGFESADNRVLEAIRKQETVAQHREAVRVCKRAGIVSKAFWMTSLPGETWASIEAIKRFMAEEMPTKYIVSKFAPYPGSDVWTHPERYGVTWMEKALEKYWNFADSSLIEYEGCSRQELDAHYADLVYWLEKEFPR